MKRYCLEDYVNSKQLPWLQINVGGQIYQLDWKFIKRYRNSRLERLWRALTHEEVLNVCDEYNLNTNEYFFDRNPKYFELIWNILKTGEFYFDTEHCIMTFLDELHYWGYSLTKTMAYCCQSRFNKEQEVIDEELQKVRAIMKQLDLADENERSNKLGRFRMKLWNIMEQPQSSILSRIVSVISVFFIVLSTVCLIISTLEVFHISSNIQTTSLTRYTITTIITTTQNYNNTFNTTLGNNKEEHQKSQAERIFDIIEYACIIWFTLEYILRFIATNNRLTFLIQFLNIVDLISIFPFYVTMIIHNITTKNNIEALDSISRVVQVFRILRILRVIKLARHSVGLQSLGYTLHKSYKELGLLMSFIVIGVYLFSSVVYFAERDANEEMFPSIPGSFWWAIISMTTVGYGDVHPITLWGKIFASICCVSGVLVVGLPIPIIVSNFSEFYKDKLRLEKARCHRNEIAANSCQQVTGLLVNSIAQHTLSFFHGFNRAPPVRSDSEVSRTNNARRKSESRKSSWEYDIEIDEFGLTRQYQSGLPNQMDILLQTDYWKYIDSSSSESRDTETDEEEI